MQYVIRNQPTGVIPFPQPSPFRLIVPAPIPRPIPLPTAEQQYYYFQQMAAVSQAHQIAAANQQAVVSQAQQRSAAAVASVSAQQAALTVAQKKIIAQQQAAFSQAQQQMAAHHKAAVARAQQQMAAQHQGAVSTQSEKHTATKETAQVSVKIPSKTNTSQDDQEAATLKEANATSLLDTVKCLEQVPDNKTPLKVESPPIILNPSSKTGTVTRTESPGVAPVRESSSSFKKSAGANVPSGIIVQCSYCNGHLGIGFARLLHIHIKKLKTY